MSKSAHVRAVVSVCVIAFFAQTASSQVIGPQQIDPIVNFTASKDADHEVFVGPIHSSSSELPPDVRLEVPDSDVAYLLGSPAGPPGAATVPQPYVQLLRGRTYVVMYNVFQSLVYKGDHGLLMIDCGGHFGPAERQRILAGLAEIGGWDSATEVGSGLPLHTLVITHPHADHCGNSLFFRETFPGLRIVASAWYDDEVRLNHLPLARPTRIIHRRFGGFHFEGEWFTMNTPVRTAHTTADSYIITPDKVLMAVDIVQADRLPFLEISVTRDLFGYIQLLRYLAGEAAAGNWEVASWGHFNVGYPRDVQLTLDYIETLFGAWTFAFLGNPIESFLDPENPASETNIAVPLRNFFDKVAADMSLAIADLPQPSRPERTWGETRFFELVRDHADQVHQLRFLSLFNSWEFEQALATGDPNAVVALIASRVPDFDPIPPGTRIYAEE